MSDWTPGWFRLGSIYTPLNAVYHLTEALHVHVSAVWMKMNGRFHYFHMNYNLLLLKLITNKIKPEPYRSV